MTTRVILYARVSTRSQAERGLSLPGQFRELRQWAEREGFGVLAEIADEGGKDSKRDVLERPGLNRVFDLCEREKVDAVVAQDRSRFGESPIPDLLAYRLTQTGTRLATPEGWEEDDEGAQLMRLVTDWNSSRERRTTARRSRSKRLEQARQGHIVPSHTAAFGYAFGGTKHERTFEVAGERMAVVERIFRMVGAEHLGIRTVARILTEEGVPLPPVPEKLDRVRGRAWNRQFLRDLILNDLYKPHTGAEVATLVEQGSMLPDVAEKAPDPCGMWWYSGTDYDGNPHRVPVPVPASGIPVEVVEAARKALSENRTASKAGGRPFWELSGGILVCGGCGRRMATHTPHVGRVKTGKAYTYHRYRCVGDTDIDKGRCPERIRLPAEATEEEVWRLMVELLTDPWRMISGVDRLIDEERSRLRGDPEAEVRALHGTLSDLTRRRGLVQDAYLAGEFSVEELGVRQSQLEEAKETILREIDAHEHRGERLRGLEHLRYVLKVRANTWNRVLDVYPDELRQAIGDTPWEYDVFANAQREELENATPEERHAHYRQLELRVVALSKEELEVSGVFGTEMLYIGASSSSGRFTPKTPPRRWTASSTSSRLTSSPR